MIRLNKFIEHTLLKSDATSHMIHRLCQEAIDHHFFAVCVNPIWVKLAKDLIKENDIKIISVVGFPLGASHTEVKVLETKKAVEDGADEIDLVINLGKLKSGNSDEVLQDITAVTKASSVPVKVIIETALLSEEEKILACQLCEKAGAHFVKTSTGYGPSGATVEDVQLIKGQVGDRLQIKASGGIRDYAKVKALIEAGASRIGTSSGIAILAEEKRVSGL